MDCRAAIAFSIAVMAVVTVGGCRCCCCCCCCSVDDRRVHTSKGMARQVEQDSDVRTFPRLYAVAASRWSYCSNGAAAAAAADDDDDDDDDEDDEDDDCNVCCGKTCSCSCALVLAIVKVPPIVLVPWFLRLRGQSVNQHWGWSASVSCLSSGAIEGGQPFVTCRGWGG